MRKFFILCVSAMMAIGMMAQPPRHHEPERGHGHGHGRGHATHQVYCATSEQLSMTLHVVGQQPFDEKKLDVAKLAVTLGHFCTDDLARIARLFTFDEGRLAFLLYAHAYCEDPENYPSLYGVFTFRTNYDELIRTLYPGGQHRR